MPLPDSSHLCEIDQTGEQPESPWRAPDHELFADAPTLHLTGQPITLDDLRQLFDVHA
jgi:hypothetical protein